MFSASLVLVVIAVIVALIALVGIISTSGDSDETAAAKIETPASESRGDVAQAASETQQAPPLKKSTGPVSDQVEAGQVTSEPAKTSQAGPQVEDDPRVEVRPLVEPDSGFEVALENARISTRGWETDFSLHTVPYDEIISGGPPRDGIAPIDHPRFTTPQEAGSWLGELEPVIALEVDGHSKAYPLQILTWHEIVNDVIGDVPVVVTFCPLCNSALAFDRRLDGVTYDFGTSGKLRHSDLIMWDRQTESWWQQLTGEGIVGKLAGTKLDFLSASIVSFADYRVANPDGEILSQDTGFRRPYGQNPYAGYDDINSSPFLFNGKVDGRLSAMDRVVSVTAGDTDAAFPFAVLEEERTVNYMVGDQDVVVFFKPGTVSALDSAAIRDSRNVGAAAVYDPNLNGQKLTFSVDEFAIVDNETGSEWNILGHAISGPLAGEKLTGIVHGDHFWFAWGAFKPDTVIYQGEA